MTRHQSLNNLHDRNLNKTTEPHDQSNPCGCQPRPATLIRRRLNAPKTPVEHKPKWLVIRGQKTRTLEKRTNRIVQTSIVTAGNVLKRQIEFLGITEEELADRMGRPASAVYEIVTGQTAITPQVALQLETIIGTKPHVWTDLESKYRLARARTAELAELESEIPLLDHFQTGKLEERGWIPRAQSQTERVRLLRAFLGVASLNVYKRVNAPAYRLHDRSRLTNETLAVWLRKGELDAAEYQTAVYDCAKFESAVRQIRTLTNSPPEHFMPEMFNSCARAGVALVFTPELPNCQVNGSARKILGGQRIIQLSLNSRWADHFWIAFFREAEYTLNGEETLHISFLHEPPDRPKEEGRLDRSAAHTLIPFADWDDFLDKRDWSENSIQSFAVEMGVHPGIVAGRLAQDQWEPPRSVDRLRITYAWPRTKVMRRSTSSHLNRTSRAAADSTPDESPATCSAPTTHYS